MYIYKMEVLTFEEIDLLRVCGFVCIQIFIYFELILIMHNLNKMYVFLYDFKSEPTL